MLCAVLCFSGLAAQAEDTDALIAKGDQFDKQLQAKEALEVYLPANKLEPDNVKLLVCIARQYRHLMSRHVIETGKAAAGKRLARIRQSRRDPRSE